MAVINWSTTASSNTTLGALSTQGTAQANTIDDLFRELMAQVATQMGKVNYKGADLASASTVDLSTATGNFVHVTGTTTITALGTVAAGQIYVLTFDGALTFTHNGTSLILPGSANITTAAGDVAVMVSEGSGNWRCILYRPATGMAGVVRMQIFASSGTYTPHANMIYAIVEGVGGGGGGGGVVGSVGNIGGAGGGGSGAYSRSVFSKATIGASQTVTIGAAGSAGAAAGGTGGNGGTTSLGSLLTAPGGQGGGGTNSSSAIGTGGGAGGSTGTGTFALQGVNGGNPFISNTTAVSTYSGNGAPSVFGGGALGVLNSPGNNGAGYGGGGSGGHQSNVATNRAGGTGAAGILIVTEICTN